METIYNKEVGIVGKISLPGELFIQFKAKGIVVLSYSRGISKFSKHNHHIINV